MKRNRYCVINHCPNKLGTKDDAVHFYRYQIGINVSFILTRI